MAKKYVNTVAIRNNTTLDGIEIIFAEAPSEMVKDAIKGKDLTQYGDAVKGKKQYKNMHFSWNRNTCLWWDYNTKALKKDLDKYIEVLKELGYKVNDQRTVEPTKAKRPNTNTTTRRRSSGGRRSSNAQTKTAPVQTEPVEAPVQTAPQTTVGATVNDVLLAIVQQNNTIIEMLRR